MQYAPNNCNRLEIDLSALDYNLENIRLKAGKNRKILAIVKADAYGHGAIEISKRLESGGKVNTLGVSNACEGIRLRKAGIKLPILVLLGLSGSNPQKIIEYDLTPVIYDSSSADKLSNAALKAGRRLKIHVKIDTGMGRLGYIWNRAVNNIEYLIHLKGIQIEGILTHFAQADAADKTFTKLQLSRFEDLLAKLEKKEIKIPLIHAANSAAIIDFAPAYFNLVRPGIMLYGAVSDNLLRGKIKLKPVMNLTSRLISLKKLPADSAISYGRTYITDKPSTIGIIPLGYALGFSRALSNKGQVLIKGIRAPVVGRVCMDISLIDVSHIKGVNIGDEVLIWGKNDEGRLPVEDTAECADTIAYELLCMVGKSLPRFYFS